MCAVAGSVAQVVKRLAVTGTGPARIKVEFGLKVAAEGKVLVAAASEEAAMRVSLTYEPRGSGGR